MEIFVTLTFDAAHSLPCVPAGHKCGNLHGHTFTVEVHTAGGLEPERGWVMDFGDLKREARAVVEQLDHRHLNAIEGLENPTSEHIARWLWERLSPRIPGLSCLVVRESPSSGAVYRGS